MPNVVISNPSQHLALAQEGMLGYERVRAAPNSVDFDDFMTGGKACYATSLATVSRLNLAGLMLNNSSVLALETTMVGAIARGVMFLEFVAIARTTLNRTQLRI